MPNTHNALIRTNNNGVGEEVANNLSGGGGGQSNIRACYDESPALYAHAVDSYIYYDSKVYKALSAIAVGDTLVVDTNIELASIPANITIGLDKLPGSGGGGSGGVTVVSATLLSANWSGSSQTITVSGMTSNSNGEAGLPSSATSAQRAAARDAKLAPTAQATDSLTITADGTVPSIDIPIEVVMY